MGQELVLPDWATKGAPIAFQKLNPQDDSLSDGIGQSYPVIGYKGKVWSFRHRGERKTFIRPDDGTPASYLDVIILGQAKQKSKSFYAAFDPNQDGGRPICSSIDGLVPDPDVQQKQSDTCALCPKNQWKQQANGKKGRDCADYKRLAVLVLPTQTKPLYGEPVLEPAFLRVPAASLNSLAIMGDTMAGQGFHYSSYITRISFDPQEAHPKMVFRPLQGLTDQEAPVILGMREDMNVGRIINGGYTEGARQIPPQEGTTLLPPGQSETGLGQVLNLQANPSTGAATQPAQATANSGTQQNASASGASAQPATTGITQAKAPAQSSAPTGLEGGAGLIGLGTAPPAQTQPAVPQQQTVGDTGAPEASDDDLDARIAGLIKK